MGRWALALTWGWVAAGCGGGGPGTTDAATGGETETIAATETSASATASPSGETGTEASGETTDPSDSSSTGEPPDDPGDPWAPVPPPQPLPEGPLAQLQATLDGILASPAVSGATQGVLIVDLETDQVLYERNPDDVLVPASNTKMFTTASTIDILGGDHRMTTEVFADAAPDGAGTVAGDLHLVGDHDFTWSTFFYPSARFPLDRIAQDLFDAGLRRVTGAAIARGEFCYEGQSLGTYDAVGHRSTAAARFGDVLVAAGIAVDGGTATSADFEPPAGAMVLASWLSTPLSGAAVHVNGPSHNEFADILLRHLGFHIAGESTYVAGGVQMRDWMESLPTDVTGVDWQDGSGLSHSNRTSPRNIVDLVRFSTTVAGGEAWLRSQAIAGVRGTLSGRMTGSDTWGRVFGKTGTLPSIGTVSVSGVLYHRHDGRRYAFSILFNGAFDVTGARSVQDQVVAALGVDLRGVTPRPAAPTLHSAVNEPGSTVVALSWADVADADGYAVWLSPDGKTFDIDDARYVAASPFRAGELPYSPVFVRVTAVAEVDAGPVHSVPTDVYGSRPSFEPSAVLVVDGNDRWQAQPVPENSRAIGHDFAAVHGAALGDHGFDTVANETVADGAVDLSSYDVVVWALGEESDVDRTFDDIEQGVVADYLEGGGGVVVSGAELGYDLAEVGTPQDTAFMLDVLRAGYAGDDAGTVVAAAGTGPLDGVTRLQFNTPADQAVGFPDMLQPSAGSTAVLQYQGGAAAAAAVAHADAGVIVFGFPLEAIDVTADRADVLQRAVEFVR